MSKLLSLHTSESSPPRTTARDPVRPKEDCVCHDEDSQMDKDLKKSPYANHVLDAFQSFWYSLVYIYLYPLKFPQRIKYFIFLCKELLDLGLEMILLKVWGNRDQYPQSAVKEIEARKAGPRSHS